MTTNPGVPVQGGTGDVGAAGVGSFGVPGAPGMGVQGEVNMVAEQERATEIVRVQLEEAVKGMYVKVNRS